MDPDLREMQIQALTAERAGREAEVAALRAQIELLRSELARSKSTELDRPLLAARVSSHWTKTLVVLVATMLTRELLVHHLPVHNWAQALVTCIGAVVVALRMKAATTLVLSAPPPIRMPPS